MVTMARPPNTQPMIIPVLLLSSSSGSTEVEPGVTTVVVGMAVVVWSGGDSVVDDEGGKGEGVGTEMSPSPKYSSNRLLSQLLG